jgi:hypothetical protein
VGQTEYVTPAHYMEIEHIWEGCEFCGHWDVAMAEAARGQWQSGLQWLIKRVLAVMDRDRRLTGYLRGQTDQALAPAGFEFTNGWRVSLSTRHGISLGDGQSTSGFTNNKLIRSRSVSCKNKTTAHTPRRRILSTVCSELYFL